MPVFWPIRGSTCSWMPSSRQETRCRPGAGDNPRLGGEALQLGVARRGHLEQRLGRQHLLQRRQQHRPAQSHAQRGDLQRRGPPEHVDHHARQIVALAVHQAVGSGPVGGKPDAQATGAGGLQAGHEERVVDRLLLAGHQAQRDLRARVPDAPADEAALMVDDRDHIPGRRLALQPLHGVAVGPGMAEPQRSGPALAQDQAGTAVGALSGRQGLGWRLMRSRRTRASGTRILLGHGRAVYAARAGRPGPGLLFVVLFILR